MIIEAYREFGSAALEDVSAIRGGVSDVALDLTDIRGDLIAIGKSADGIDRSLQPVGRFVDDVTGPRVCSLTCEERETTSWPPLMDKGSPRSTHFNRR